MDMLLQLPPGTVTRGAQVPNRRYGTGGATPADQTNHPHLVDLYVPSVPVQIVVLALHGGGGTQANFAGKLGIVKKAPITAANVVWNPLNSRSLAIAIPQGQYCKGVDAAWGSGNNPWNPADVNTVSAQNPSGVATWSNYVMRSGYDDPQFLRDAALWLKDMFPGAIRLLAGHSNGGMMVNRMWYEHVDGTFHGYCSASGPPSTYYRDTAPATPSVVAPLLEQHALQDANIGIIGGHFQDATWTLSQDSVAFVNHPGTVVGAWQQLQRRVNAYNTYKGLAPQTITYGSGVATAAQVGNVTNWVNSDGGQRLRLYSAPDHDIANQQRAAGHRIVLDWAGFGYSMVT